MSNEAQLKVKHARQMNERRVLLLQTAPFFVVFFFNHCVYPLPPSFIKTQLILGGSPHHPCELTLLPLPVLHTLKKINLIRDAPLRLRERERSSQGASSFQGPPAPRHSIPPAAQLAASFPGLPAPGQKGGKGWQTRHGIRV